MLQRIPEVQCRFLFSFWLTGRTKRLDFSVVVGCAVIEEWGGQQAEQTGREREGEGTPLSSFTSAAAQQRKTGSQTDFSSSPQTFLIIPDHNSHRLVTIRLKHPIAKQPPAAFPICVSTTTWPYMRLVKRIRYFLISLLVLCCVGVRQAARRKRWARCTAIVKYVQKWLDGVSYCH